MKFIIVIILIIVIPSLFMDRPLSEDDIECPACGSHDTDGNHCYQCGEDF